MLAGPSPEALIGPIAGVTQRDPRRQRWRDAPRTTARSRSQRASACSPACTRTASTWRSGALPAATGSHRSRCSATADPRSAQRVPLTSSPNCSGTSRTGCHPTTRCATSPRTLPGRPYAARAVVARILVRRARCGLRSWGMPYAFADFINPLGATIAETYHQRFAETGRAGRPRRSRSPCGHCALTEQGGGGASRREQPPGRS